MQISEFAGVLVLGVIAVLLLVAMGLIIKFRYKVVEPNSALIIAGTRSKGSPVGGQSPTEGTPSSGGGGLKVVQGGGVFVFPIFQKAYRLSLQTMETSVDVKNVPSKNKVPVNVDTTANIRIGDTIEDINGAATRFLGWTLEQINTNAREILAGSLRSIIGQMTVEEIIEDREGFSERVQQVASKELRPMGLVIDVMNIKEISDDQDYINNLGVAEIERVRKDAEMVKANTTLEISRNQLAADQQQAQITRDTEIKKSEFKAEQDAAQKRADQAGPLAEAEAKMAVVQKDTEVAALESALKESNLQTDIIKPAEAEAQKNEIEANARAKQTEIDAAAAAKKTEIEAAARAKQIEIEAKASAEQTKLEGDAKAHSTKVTGEAEAAADKARAEAEGAKIRETATARAEGMSKEAEALNSLSGASVGLKQIEIMPEIVERAGMALGNVRGGIYVSGQEGMDHVLSFVPQLVSQGMAMATGNYKPDTDGGSPGDGSKVTSIFEHRGTPVSKLDVTEVGASLTQALDFVEGADLREKFAAVRAEGGDLVETFVGSEMLDELIALAESVANEGTIKDQVEAFLNLVNADPKLSGKIVNLMPTIQALVKKLAS